MFYSLYHYPQIAPDKKKKIFTYNISLQNLHWVI
jgi:hypothetical protein